VAIRTKLLFATSNCALQHNEANRTPMYENHFKLERRLFRGNASGPDVFVGPQMAKLMSGIKKAVAGYDGVVSVAGPVGSGKSTAVAHALGSISGKNAIVRIGRYPLQRGEVLDLLFDHMQIRQRPQRNNLKLSLFRQLLFNLAKNKARMFILVEDAPFLGPEILAELEVMTAADTGASDGAGIILMGDESLREFLGFKSLARLRQRVRLRAKLEACNVDELRGYLTHSMRRAGGDFSQVFAEGMAELLHELTGGILRVTNNLVESALEASAEAGASRVDLELVSRIANEEFGLTGKFVTPPAMPGTEPEPRHTDESTAELVALSMPEPEKPKASPANTDAEEPDEESADPVALAIADAVGDITPDAVGDTDPQTAPDAEKVDPVAELPAEPLSAAPETSVEDDIPELIQDTQPGLSTLETNREPNPVPELIHDTLPNLSVLSPELAEQAEALEALDDKPEPVQQPDAASQPAAKTPVAPAAQASPEKPPPEVTDPAPAPAVSAPPPAFDSSPLSRGSNDDKPDWDREPTLAELRPDLEALERAMAVAQGRDPDAPEEEEEEVPMPVAVDPEPEAGEEPEGIPEITLDESINRKVDRAELERKKRREEETGVIEESEAPGGEEKADERRQGQADAELEKIAVGLAKAKTLDDVDDRMAETLFGEELSIAAAEVARKVAEEAAAEEAATATPEPVQAAANDSPALENTDPSPEAKEFESVWGQKPDTQVSIESQFDNHAAGLDVSASQRLATVRALNAESAPAAPPPKAPAAAPVSIEEQITTSMTQTLKALKVQPAPTPLNDDDDDEEPKSGFFSRFRRS
jgi:type II secretory pathway predicted ATPase ExeA